MKGPYPAPLRFRWTCMIELPDGNVVYGTGPTDLLERWGRMLGWVTGEPLSASETRRAVSRYLTAFYAATPPARSLSDADWLEALNDTNVVTFIDKG